MTSYLNIYEDNEKVVIQGTKVGLKELILALQQTTQSQENKTSIITNFKDTLGTTIEIQCLFMTQHSLEH